LIFSNFIEIQLEKCKNNYFNKKEIINFLERKNDIKKTIRNRSSCYFERDRVSFSNSLGKSSIILTIANTFE
jgi:hypothetical protein